MSAGQVSVSGAGARRPLLDIVSIAAGSFVGQVAVFLSSVVITRLVSPEELGVYSYFAALVGIIALIGSFHYELAIPVAKSKESAMSAALASLSILLIVALVSAPAMVLLNQHIINAEYSADLETLLYWLPLAIILTGGIRVGTQFCIRFQWHGTSGLAKLTQGVGQAVLQIVGVALGAGALGLVLGQLLAQFIPMLLMGRKVASLSPLQLGHAWRRVRHTLAEYKNFPLYATPSSGINSIAVYLPTFFTVTKFGAELAGLYALAFRALHIPITFISQAVSQVFFSSLIQIADEQEQRAYVIRTLRALIALSATNALIMMPLLKGMFALIFGEAWAAAGTISALLAPWLVCLFISTALSVVVSMKFRQKTEMTFQVIYLAALGLNIAIGIISDSWAVFFITMSVLGSVALMLKVVWLVTLFGESRAGAVGVLASELVLPALYCLFMLIMAQLISFNYLIFIALVLILVANSYNIYIRGVFRIWGVG